MTLNREMEKFKVEGLISPRRLSVTFLETLNHLKSLRVVGGHADSSGDEEATDTPDSRANRSKINLDHTWTKQIQDKMYADWSSLTLHLQTLGTATQSVLAKLPPEDAKQVVASVVKTVASHLGITVPTDARPSSLQTEQEVNWAMEVICHGLCLPLTDHEVIRDCVNIYCEWLSALLPNPKVCVPKPVLEDPNFYAQKIITHFNHLFVPRKGEAQETIHRQAVVCHRVLRRVQELAQQSQVMERETWEALLSFLLAINDALLSPPTVKDDVGDQLCERVLGVLYEIWLIACVKSFPNPTLWKTFREMCMNWRHRTGLVMQWNRVNLALTSRLLAFLYGPNFPSMNLLKEDLDLVPPEMSQECVAQAWFRFLHSLGNPVDLSKPVSVSNTQQFKVYAIKSDSVIEPTYHPCLQALPAIFLRSMKGISAIVDAYLGLPRNSQLISLSRTTSAASSTSGMNTSASSLQGSTAHALASSSALIANVTGTLSEHQNVAPSPLRPSCNSILHLFGVWLFEAAFIGTELCMDKSGADVGSGTTPQGVRRSADYHNHPVPHGARPTSLPSAASSKNAEAADLPPSLSPDKFESGRAEALGALCRIFCCKRTGEEILPVYLARFYLAVQRGLAVGPDKVVSETLASVLLNSSNLLRLDLEGVNVLVPAFITALEAVLPEREIKLVPGYINRSDLRRAAIHLLQSILTLPLHFANMPIKELLPTGERPSVTHFSQLKPRLVNLLISALQVENEAVNTQMLLGSLMLTVQDSAALEQLHISHQDGFSDHSGRNSNGIFNAGGSDSQSENNRTPADDHLDNHHGTTDQSPDSAHALFVRATYLVCHRLISSWKSDLNTSLAALELLSGLAKIKIPEQDALECKRAVKWLCDYIVTQCSRPPPAHSRDLHSSIVAAFQACITWLVHHPYLLHDKECLATVLEVAELGVSGSKSQQKASDSPVMKEDKQLNPASRRVRDAAEHLLSTVMEQVGYFPGQNGTESLSSLLDESSLLRHCRVWEGGDVSPSRAIQSFRYFVIDQSVMLSILEESLHCNQQDPHPTVTVIIRCPSNKAVWSLELRHLPRHKSGQVPHSVNPGRPLGMAELNVRKDFKPCFFPDSIDRIPLCAADRSIPAVESVAGDEDMVGELDRLSRLMEQQSILEKQLSFEIDENNQDSFKFECVPPEMRTEFQTARLLLSHLGFLSIPALRASMDSPVPRLVALNTDNHTFFQDLNSLDRQSPRTQDTILCYYVRAGQTRPADIVANSRVSSSGGGSGGINPLYLECLASLGWPVDVHSHPGWTGNPNTSFKITNSPQNLNLNNDEIGPAKFDGSRSILYWSDVSSELAILVPSCLPPATPDPDSISVHSSGSGQGGSDGHTVDGGDDNRGGGSSASSLSLELAGVGDSATARRNKTAAHHKMGRSGPSSSGPFAGGSSSSQRVAVIWLESLEDALTCPVDQLGEAAFRATNQSDLANSRVTNYPEGSLGAAAGFCLVIYVHPLDSGLLRIKLSAPQHSRMTVATPLVDGMVVSRRALGVLIIQTSLNMCRRRRLEIDSYQPPHVRRKLKIQEMVQRYRSNMTESEFYAHLFQNPAHK